MNASPLFPSARNDQGDVFERGTHVSLKGIEPKSVQEVIMILEAGSHNRTTCLLSNGETAHPSVLRVEMTREQARTLARKAL